MKISCATEDGRATEIEVSESTTFEDIKIILAVEFKTQPHLMALSFKGDSSIPDSETLGNQGVGNNDMLLVIIKQNLPTSGLATLDGLIEDPRIRNLDFGKLFGGRPGTQSAAKNEAAIRENYEMAMQEAPESFAQVYMLYITVEVNGVEVKAFVDSGAQTTIMSKKCAVQTGMIELVDPRFAGVAMGVGAARVIGKVHLSPLKIEDTFYNASFSVLDQVQNVDLLIGLDFLKRYQCSIDLAKDGLHIGTSGQMVPFLTEAQLPAHAKLNGAH